MVSLNEMADAHIKNVHQKIEELKGQQAQIEQEVARLSMYLEQCVEELASQKSPTVPNPPAFGDPTTGQGAVFQ
jgi:prefoldin subunit 5